MKGALCPSNKFRFQQMFQGAWWVDSIQTGCAESKENQIQAGHLLKNIFTVYIYILYIYIIYIYRSAVVIEIERRSMVLEDKHYYEMNSIISMVEYMLQLQQ